MNEKILIITGPFILGEILRRNQLRLGKLCRKYGPKQQPIAQQQAQQAQAQGAWMDAHANKPLGLPWPF